MSDQSQPPSARRRSALGAALATLVLGAGLGLGAGYLLFDGSSDGGAADAEARAANHVEYGCQVFDRIAAEDRSLEEMSSIEEEPLFWEVPAAAHLLVSAAILDPQYEDLREPGMAAIRSLQTLDLDDLASSATEACAAR